MKVEIGDLVSPVEEAFLEKPFWPAAIDILQTHDTDKLERLTLAVAERAQNIDTASFHETVTLAKELHKGKKRKFTDTDYMVHLYQNFLITTKYLGVDTITDTMGKISILHDSIEDTAATREFIEDKTGSADIAFGVSTLSHKANGRKLYPEDHEKVMYFGNIATVNMVRPELGLGLIKAVDQLAGANDPMTVGELSNPSLRGAWEDLSRQKVQEMHGFRKAVVGLPKGEALGGIITDFIGFSDMRIAPETAGMMDNVLTLRTRRNGGNLPTRRVS